MKLEINLREAGFSVSVAGLDELVQFCDALKKTPTHVITASEEASLARIMTMVERMVFAEAQTKRIFVIGDTRFNTDHLLNAPHRMFTDGVFAKLPFLTMHDGAEAFQCLIHGRATAAAFHILRATESVLHAYYMEKIKRGREKNPMWGNMVAGLRKKRDKDENLLQRLDFIRVTYRNPTAHPEEIYNLGRAEDLIGLCIEVINTMASSLPQRPAEPEPKPDAPKPQAA